MAKLNILVALSTFSQFGEAPLNLLKESGYDYTINPLGRRLTASEVIEMGKDADAIVAGLEPYDKDVLNALPKLKCVSRCGVGIDNIDQEVAAQKSVAIRNTPNVVILPVAELTLSMILDLLRNVSYYTCLMRSKKWQRTEGHLLAGSKIGVLGLGRIGRQVADILAKLGANVLGADLFPDHEWAKKCGVKIVEKEELLKECDIVTLHVADSKDVTGYVIGDADIKAMKKGAMIVNTARGRFLDEAALVEALKTKHLGGAALDVYSEEPYHGPLCDLDNVVLTPHVATLTNESRIQMEVEAVQNAIDFCHQLA